MSDVLREWVERATYENATLREQNIRGLLQPRPRWLPTWLWQKLIGRLLVIEERDI